MDMKKGEDQMSRRHTHTHTTSVPSSREGAHKKIGSSFSGSGQTSSECTELPNVV